MRTLFFFVTMKFPFLSGSPDDATAHLEFLRCKSAELSLEEFIAALPETIRQIKMKDLDSPDPIADLMEYVPMCL